MGFGYKEFIIFLLGWNILAFAIMGIDKWKSIKGRRRISESSLILFAFFFGAIGVLTGMFTFRHKTKKPLFITLIFVAFAVNFLMVIGASTLMR